jgi:hypothetical protein
MASCGVPILPSPIWSDGPTMRCASWHAAIISGGPIRVIQHWESFEVLRDGKRKKFFFDTSAFRRGISGRMSKDEAKQQALAFAQCAEDRIEIDPDEAGPPPWAE